MNKFFRHAASDIPASIVVFLVAVPLCLGVALGSSAPLFSGLIAGVIGGIVVGAISNSPLSVSGPAAGLIATVAMFIGKLPAFEAFLLAVLLAGVIQIALGLFKAGVLASFVPSSVLRGMLAAIGLLLILKQFPHLVGYDADFEGDQTFLQKDGHNTFSELEYALLNTTPLAMIIGFLGIGIQVFWDSRFFPSKKVKTLLPAPLVVVVLGVFLNKFAGSGTMNLKPEHLVNLPVLQSIGDVTTLLRFPSIQYLTNLDVWIAAFTIAIIASIESLLSIQAVDKLDNEHRVTSPNRELIAQGTGNMLSGLIGGIPITSVIVRSSANVNSGAKTKFSTIMHGSIMLVAILVFPTILNLIPLSALAAILIYTGYKLANPSVFGKMYREGFGVFLPFVITITAIMLSDLLIGVCIGILVGIYFVIRSNYYEGIKFAYLEDHFMVKFQNKVTFLNKVLLMKTIEKIPEGSKVYLDFSRCTFLDHDILEQINDFHEHCKYADIKLEFRFLNDKQRIKLNL